MTAPPDDILPFCLECGDYFREDDTGGYNPECRCGKEHCVSLCRNCCGAIKSDTADEDEYERPEESYPEEPTAGGARPPTGDPQ